MHARRQATPGAVGAYAILFVVATMQAHSAPEDEAVSLSLRETVRRALADNLSLRISAIEPQVSEQKIRQQKAAFEPAFYLQAGWESSDRPLNTREFIEIGGDPATAAPGLSGRVFSEDILSYSSGITGLLPSGARYDFSAKGNRLKNDLNRSVPPGLFYPEYDSFLGLTLTQPLLRGAGREVNSAAVRVAEEEAQISLLGHRQTLEDTSLEVVEHYCRLAHAAGEILVKKDLVRLADELRQANSKLLEQGVGSALDVTEAEAAVAFREDELEQARAQFVGVQGALMKLTGGEWGGSPAPADRGIMFRADARPARMIQAALENRSDYQAALAAVRKQDIELRFAKNQQWPQLDLKASAGLLGLDDRAAGAFSQAANAKNTAWSVGLQLTIPLGGNEAKAQVRAADLRKLQSLLNVKRLEQEILIDIETALRSAGLHQRRIGLARKAVELAATRVDQEARKLQAGTTTSYAVLQMQRDLGSARSQELLAIMDFNQSAARLAHVQGTLLRALGFLVRP